MTIPFALPDGFLFGASTSPHQVEGNNVASDWWAFENRPGTPAPERSGDACDSFERWPEDMGLLRSLGFGAYRFGVEWARIEPVRGEYSRAAIAHYTRMVEHAVAIGLEPVLTLHHFTHPLWFTRDGGWGATDAIERFLGYVDAIAPVIDAGARTVITVNEPNMLAVMQTVIRGEGALETGLGGGLPLPHRETAERIAEAHRAAVDLLHATHPGVQVGWSIANQAVEHIDGGEARAAAYRETREDWFLRHSREDDFVGVQSYTRTVFGADGIVPPASDAPRTLTGWEVYPRAIGTAIRQTAHIVPGVPILVTENGIATADDAQRIAYTTGALDEVVLALEDGIDVRGYLHWSALDNYEWGHWGPTFGLIAVDRQTFAREPKPSARWLGEIARSRLIPASATSRAALVGEGPR
jgi:beta-glucosidase